MNIVDTPGTNAVVEGHEALTRDFVPRSELVLFVTSADRPFTQSERQFLGTIRDWGKKVVVAVNKIDILEDPADVEKVVEFVRDKLRELLGLRPEVFGVSARQTWKAKTAGYLPDAARNGFGALEAYLSRTLDDVGRLRVKLESPLGVADRAIEVAASGRRPGWRRSPRTRPRSRRSRPRSRSTCRKRRATCACGCPRPRSRCSRWRRAATRSSTASCACLARFRGSTASTPPRSSGRT